MFLIFRLLCLKITIHYIHGWLPEVDRWKPDAESTTPPFLTIGAIDVIDPINSPGVLALPN